MSNHTSESRQEQLRRLDAWLSMLHAKHPFLFNLLAVALVVGVFSLAMLLKVLLGGSL